jgi:hypothetical protein
MRRAIEAGRKPYVGSASRGDAGGEGREGADLMCAHANLHPARVDGCVTVCLDCGIQVTITLLHYTSGVTPQEQAKEMWERLQAKVRINESLPEWKGPIL